MGKWKVAIIGTGNIARMHAKHYRVEDRVEVVALCDIVESKAVSYKNDFFPNAKVYTDYKELLKDDSIDSVDICTPNYLHSVIAVDAFNSGKHVFTEKPDAVSVEEVLKMNEASQKADKTLMVMRNNRFLDASVMAKKFIDNGEMGEIYCGRCGWQRRRGIPGKRGWFTNKEQSGGGPLIDLGVHMIDLAIWLMGNPTPVSVSGNTFCKFADSELSDSVHSQFGEKKSSGVFDVEDLAMGMIRFGNGTVLQIEFSWASNVKKERRFVELRGTKAGLKWEDAGVEFFSEMDGQLVDICPPNCHDEKGHENNLKHFYDVVIDGVEPNFKPQQGIDMIKILCAIYESAKTGKEVIL